jgi:hypothetical protein
MFMVALGLNANSSLFARRFRNEEKSFINLTPDAKPDESGKIEKKNHLMSGLVKGC